MRPRLIQFAVVLAVACALVDRAADAADALVSGRYAITSWTDQDGLPMTQIWGLAQTRDGYLWAATTAGLVRFDGETFRLGVRGVPEGEATTVYASRDGGLWVALTSGQVSRVREDGRV